jgi:CRP-like cAMP-binding protein
LSSCDDERFEKLEKDISKLNLTVDEIKASLNQLLALSKEKVSYQEGVVERMGKGPNPWALQTSNILTSAMNSLDRTLPERVARTNYETYKGTIDALFSNPVGLTADEVAQKTGRRRNTESAYLYKLFLAGLVDRKRRKNRTIYLVNNKEKVIKAFG